MDSHAFEQIIKPYQSARSSGMGGVVIMTGFYDENFYGNPARMADNPGNRVQLLDVMGESNRSTFDTVGDISGGGGDTLSKIGPTTGRNNHGRLQTSFPGFYWTA